MSISRPRLSPAWSWDAPRWMPNWRNCAARGYASQRGYRLWAVSIPLRWSGCGREAARSRRWWCRKRAACLRAPALDADHLGQEIPTRAMLQISARAGGDAIVEDMGKNARTQNALRLRVLIPFPAHGEKFLQLMRTVPAPLARNMQEAQRAWRDYQIKKLGRTGLRKMYIGTLTLALFFASFLAMILALVLGNQLTRPLFLLAQGTREVARGDYTPKREIRSKDELGFLTQSLMR